MSKVSICIPAYGNASGIRRLLESIEIQTYKDFEVIITDDSEDESIAEIVRGKSYIKYLRNKKRLGAAANWNAAIGSCNGSYVKIMHHDDCFTDKDSLGKFVDLLDCNPQADMAFSGTVQVESGNSHTRYIDKEDADFIRKDYRNLYLGNTIGSPSAVIVRKMQVFYDKNLSWLVDMDYFMQILKKNPELVYTEEALVSIGISENQMTESCRDSAEVNIREYGYIYKKYNLKDKRIYRNKLAKVCVDFNKKYEDAEAFDMKRSSYYAALLRKLYSKFEWKLTHIISGKAAAGILILFFIFSLIPIFMLSDVNQATGDDFGYGKLTNAAWQATHSLPEVVKAAVQTVKNYYYGWQGTWMSIFLFCFQPEVFSPNAYFIVPYLMLALWIGTTMILCYYLLVKMAGFGKGVFWALSILQLTAGIQFIPSTKSSIFWYNGAAHYMIPYAMVLVGIFCFLRFMREEKKYGAYAGMLLCFFLLGGVNYQAAVLAPIVVILLLPVFYFFYRNKKKIALAMLPVIIELPGLIVSMKAPGNWVRGGEDFGFSAERAVSTIFRSFSMGAVQIAVYIKEHPLLLAIFFLMAVIVWECGKQKEYRIKFRSPGLFILMAYCVYCAMYSPQIYVGVEVSGGVYNMNYQVFLLMISASIVYLTGWLSGKMRRKNSNGSYLLLSFALIMVFTVGFKGTIKNTTSYQCIDYMQTGQAADFKDQMRLQKSILLDSNVKNAVLPFISDDQGPLMHMPITSDADAWTNTTTAEFYGKESIIAVPREEWVKFETKTVSNIE